MTSNVKSLIFLKFSMAYLRGALSLALFVCGCESSTNTNGLNGQQREGQGGVWPFESGRDPDQGPEPKRAKAPDAAAGIRECSSAETEDACNEVAKTLIETPNGASTCVFYGADRKLVSPKNPDYGISPELSPYIYISAGKAGICVRVDRLSQHQKDSNNQKLNEDEVKSGKRKLCTDVDNKKVCGYWYDTNELVDEKAKGVAFSCIWNDDAPAGQPKCTRVPDKIAPFLVLTQKSIETVKSKPAPN